MTTFLIALGIGLFAAIPVAFVLLRQRPGLRVPVVALVAVVAVVGAWSWWQYGTSDNAASADRLAQHAENPGAGMNDLAASYEARLAEAGDDVTVDQLVLLGRTHEAARDYGKAAEAYARANAKTDYGHADLLVAEAEARLNAPHAGGSGVETASERLEQALAAEPQHPGANYYTGAMAVQAGEFERAIPHFEIVLASGILEPDAAELLRQRIVEWGGSPPEAGSQPVADDGALVITVDAGAEARDISGLLFVFVRRPDGPPMPIAAKRMVNPTFPVEVRLTDDDRLMGGESLRSYQRLTVGARLSTSGQPGGNAGDPYAEGEILPASEPVAALRVR